MSGHRTSTIHRLHQQYGSTVIIGPQEISVSDISNVKELYGQHTTFLKAPVYESFTVPPIGIFSMRNKTAHSNRRRLLSHAFAQSNLLESEPLIQAQISRLLDVVRAEGERPVDVLQLFRLAAFDIVGNVLRVCAVIHVLTLVKVNCSWASHLEDWQPANRHNFSRIWICTLSSAI